MSRFQLHENQRVPIGDDKVDFSRPGTQALRQNRITARDEMAGRIIFGDTAGNFSGAAPRCEGGG